MDPETSVAEDARIRLRAGLISLTVALLMLAAKYQAYRTTGSTAVLSDALESIVNVVAAVFALGGLVFAGRPADRNHPYGHGKIEFFSAAFEGGLIAFASVVIVYEAVRILFAGSEVRQISTGVLIVLATGLVNLVLGWYLVRTGRGYNSLTLVADGKHVIADFWTSAGVVVGLLLVQLTGLAWLDPLVALLVALSLMWTGFKLVRHAAGGLLDEEDPILLSRVLNVSGSKVPLMPALLTSTSSLPKCESVAAIASCQAASLITSRWTKRPASPRPSATCRPSASSTSATTTFAPSLAKMMASLWPMPLAPPEISATLPPSLISSPRARRAACPAEPPLPV